MSRTLLDVIQISDFRLPGGTTSSIAEEVRSQSNAGISTGLLHIAGSVTNYPIKWSSHINSVIDMPHVYLLTPYSDVHAKVIVFRHPTVALSMKTVPRGISADHVVIVANHAAVDAAGTQHYNIEETDEKVRQTFGVDPIWAPIGPVVRGTMLEQTQKIPLRPDNWSNIFQQDSGDIARSGYVDGVPVLGRHSRPQRGKWPSSSEDILNAYPDSNRYRVRILGGSSVAEKIVGHVPQSWEVIPFGGMEPRAFLRGIDFWVYMHHPDLKEAFGRAAMEALASGCVAIMPPYMEELFGDAALYARPEEVQGLVNEYYSDQEKFLAKSRLAQSFARSFSPATHIERLGEFGIKPVPMEWSDGPGPNMVSSENEVGPSGFEGPGRRMILVRVSERGELDYVRSLVRAREGARSLIVAIVDRLDTSNWDPSIVYISGPEQLNTSLPDWDAYLAERLKHLLSQFDFDGVVFVGSVPPKGFITAIADLALSKTWQRTTSSNLEFCSIDEKDEDELLAEKTFQAVYELSLISTATGSFGHDE